MSRVTDDRPVVREYVDDCASALIVPPEDPVALGAAITRLLSDDTLVATLGAAARQRVAEHHTMPRFAQGLAGVFERLR